MKKIACIALSLVWGVAAFSQSAKQIVSQMQEYVNAHESEGVSFTEEVGLLYVHGYRTSYFSGEKNDRIHIPVQSQGYRTSYFSGEKNGIAIISNVETTKDMRETNLEKSKVAILDKKSRTESSKQTEFIDLDIDKKWTIMADKNEINHDFVNIGDLHSFGYHFKGLDYIAPAYRYKIIEETDDTWTITGKRKLITKYLGSEKRIELVVRKDTYQPVSMTFYYVIDGKPFDVTEITRKKDIQFGVTEQQVTFNPEDYQGFNITGLGF